MYIWAWHAAAFPPEWLISSRMSDPSRMLSPGPPYSWGISAAR